jgi:hypothetical protein
MMTVMRIPMKVPMIVWAVRMVVTDRPIDRTTPQQRRVSQQIMQRRAGDTDHSVEHGEKNRGQPLKPVSWHRSSHLEKDELSVEISLAERRIVIKKSTDVTAYIPPSRSG